MKIFKIIQNTKVDNEKNNKNLNYYFFNTEYYAATLHIFLFNLIII
jgi:hypothetical protein